MHTEISFTTTPIVLPPLALPSREIGACVEFQGLVRELENGAPLAGLHYEAYEPMARRELDRLCATLGALHPIHTLVFIHRTGWVPVGEASMFIRILASHRAEALAFCATFIDELKRTVPIWKKAS